MTFMNNGIIHSTVMVCLALSSAIAGAQGWNAMSVAWFTCGDMNKPFSFCDNIGQGHPNHDFIFAEGQFYLMTRTSQDFMSSCPWIETVGIRVGVDSK